MFMMMSDIFSSFDPISFNSTLPSTSLILFINIIMMVMIHLCPIMYMNRTSATLLLIGSLIIAQLNRTFLGNFKIMVMLTSSLFTTIMLMNLMGLIPYFFSISSHLIFTLTCGFPLWLSMILSSFSAAPKASIAHFLPDGAPDWLNPFLVLIETTSVSVRPLTLSFRLAANMSAGHIVLSLIGIYCAGAFFSNHLATLTLLSISIGYILFEVAICLIQAYIFCLLLSLYSDEHSH